MSQTPVIGARGVYDNPSQFANMPEGALVTASNVYIDRDFLITSRRGFNTIACAGLKSYKFFYFKDTFMGINSALVKYASGAWSASSFLRYDPSSTAYPVMMGIANNNAYIPYQGYLTNSSIDYPVFKLEDPTAFYSAFLKPGQPAWQPAGLPGALNVYSRLTAAALTPLWFLANSVVAYRAVIGYRDSNDNFIIGEVSPRTLAYSAGAACYPLLSISIPGGSTSGVISGATYDFSFPVIAGYHIVQLYRSAQVANTIVPNDELFLVNEHILTDTDITNNYVAITDLISEGISTTPLYTNDSQEGINNNNSRLPHAKIVSNYKSMMIYSNYKTQHSVNIQLLSIAGSEGLDASCYMRFWLESSTAINFDNRDLFIDFAAATDIALHQVGTIGVMSALNCGYVMQDMANVISISDMAPIIGAKASTDQSSFVGLLTLTTDYPIHVISMNAKTSTAFGLPAPITIKIVLGAGTVSTTTGRFTSAAHGLSTGDFLCVFWDEPTDATGTNPGAITVSTVPYWAIRFDANNFQLASSQVNAIAGIPIIPTTTGSGTLSFSRPVVSSGQNYFPNHIAPSKTGRPEEVPMAYAIPVGAANFEILNTVQLRDTFFIFKEDGLWIATGEDHKNISVQQFDPTCILVAIDSVALLNNAIFALSRKGVVKITENGVEIISDMVRNPIQSIVTSIGSNYNLKISGTAYESENKYYLSIPASVSPEFGGKTWVYNTLTNTWTTIDKYFTCGMVNINENKIHFGRDVNATAYAERKTGDYTDYCDEDLSVTISTITGNSIALVSASGVVVGDVLYQSSTIWAYITAVSSNTVTVFGTPGFTTGVRTVKKKFDQEVEYYPIHASAPGVLKNFREVTFHQQNPQYYKINYLFRSDYSGSEEGSEMSSDTWMNGTFGFGPFGGTPWGGISAEYNESPRIMIPRNKSKATYLVPIVKMNYAFSKMNLAGLSMNFNSISERTRK
jgi:hypothetical protein